MERSPITVDGVVAGFLLVERSDAPSVDAREFADFFIFKKFRRRGIGRRVVEDVIANSSSPWIVRVFYDDLNANGFWQSLFSSSLFRSLRELGDPHEGSVRTYLLNERTLDESSKDVLQNTICSRS